MSGPHWVCSRSWRVCLPGLHCSKLQVALQGSFLKQALGCVPFPGLSRSGSGPRVLHRGTDSVGLVFCALPGSEQLRRPGAWRMHTPQVGGASHHPCPGCSVSWVCSGSAVSGVACVSSGELISGCDPPGGCQPSGIPGRLGQQPGACSR